MYLFAAKSTKHLKLALITHDYWIINRRGSQTIQLLRLRTSIPVYRSDRGLKSLLVKDLIVIFHRQSLCLKEVKR